MKTPLLELKTAAPAPGLSSLLGQGVQVPFTCGTDLHRVLCDQVGLDPQVVDNEIQTVFLNGHPVDNLQAVYPVDGDQVALSAAMPGLAGATLRRGGHLAAMRGAISKTGRDTCPQPAPGRLVIKLFNLAARRLGPGLLARGVLLPAGRLVQWLADMSPLAAAPVLLDAEPVSIEQAAARLGQLAADAPVLVRVTPNTENSAC